MTLSEAIPGSTYRVAGLDLTTELSRRLEALGMICLLYTSDAADD